MTMKRLEAPDGKELTRWAQRYDRAPQIYPAWPPKPHCVMIVVVKRELDAKMYAYAIEKKDDANQWMKSELQRTFRVLFFQLPNSLVLNQPNLFPDSDPLTEKDLQYVND